MAILTLQGEVEYPLGRWTQEERIDRLWVCEEELEKNVEEDANTSRRLMSRWEEGSSVSSSRPMHGHNHFTLSTSFTTTTENGNVLNVYRTTVTGSFIIRSRNASGIRCSRRVKWNGGIQWLPDDRWQAMGTHETLWKLVRKGIRGGPLGNVRA